tara:strand:+ start:4101 stop:4496 length:396 start_codon:yes stop_codon:yes gene_type:complete
MARPKGKSGSGTRRFVMLPHNLLSLPEFINLSFTAKSLLIEFLIQYNGKNNGDFSNTRKILLPRGWSSNATIQKATSELIKAELIILSRQGGRHKCNLYGITWEPINECGGKLDISPTRTPLKPLSFRKHA